ncbi:MotA/TolQ/ExbB proton channel family protein [Paracraurococcus lichenis]|uniref:MotA/TolQ/ExbB proton channel family protein n=1 Tax=Paracraurococcus lichenis TaxID=3064888 RepID=A0ABT9E6B8_9PROT|nr:MotA/TolQ/ExbB proton channel family protein [Paracraurococcus sp. LOR1-02]MDO9711703.1 MotA/TolQ/ExbB proton channel family protein [Paracraurococcus sp. LOR1-02]
MTDAPDLSPLALVLQADPVVQGVMALLLLASLAGWAVILEKAVALRGLAREARRLAAQAAQPDQPPPGGEGLAAAAMRAGQAEWREGREAAETAGEFRARIEHAMRASVAARLRGAEPGLPLLATIGSVSPFIGLFGTVWGIMHSFAGIAAQGDTSLATVAPGIAEALFATAVGLVAAIPATIAYNRCATRLSRIRQEALAAATAIAHRLARQPRVFAGGRAAAE